MVVGEHQMAFAGHGQRLKACPDGRDAVEVLFFRALDHVTGWELVAGRLELTGPSIRLELQRPPLS